MTTAADVITFLERQPAFLHVGEIARQTGASHATVRKAIALLGSRIETAPHPGPAGGDQRRAGVTGYRVVTWTSGGEPVPYVPVFEDPSLPHQVVSLITTSHGLSVTCNCLRRPAGKGAGRGSPRELIAFRGLGKPFPWPDALAAWRDWHERHGVSV